MTKSKTVFSTRRIALATLCIAALTAGNPAKAAEENAENLLHSNSEGLRDETRDASTMAFAEDGNDMGGADDSRRFFSPGGRLLLTGGVTQIEGAGGGGLSPWALIGTYGTRDQLGVSAFATGVNSEDFSLSAYGGTIAYGNRIELSIARQNFNLNAVGAALGLGREFTISQTIVGAKLRLFGDAVLEQDSLLPQVSLGVQYKDNNRPGVVIGALAARDDDDFDYYVSATKIFLAQSLLVNGTARLTRANQFGILGFGGPGDNDYSVQFEGSVALLLSRHFAVGGEYRTKPDNLGFKEEDAFDLFVAYAPVHNITATLAYVDLGNVALRSQHALYASLQFAF